RATFGTIVVEREHDGGARRARLFVGAAELLRAWQRQDAAPLRARGPPEDTHADQVAGLGLELGSDGLGLTRKERNLLHLDEIVTERLLWLLPQLREVGLFDAHDVAELEQTDHRRQGF